MTQIETSDFRILRKRADVTRCVRVQLSPAITDVKGPTNFFCFWRIFVIANKEKIEGPQFEIHYWQISITPGSGKASLTVLVSFDSLICFF